MKILIILGITFSINVFAQSGVNLLNSDLKFSEIITVEVRITKHIFIKTDENITNLGSSDNSEPYCLVRMKRYAEASGDVLRADRGRKITGKIVKSSDSPRNYEIHPNDSAESVDMIDCYNIKTPSDLAIGLGEYAIISAPPLTIDDYNEVRVIDIDREEGKNEGFAGSNKLVSESSEVIFDV